MPEKKDIVVSKDKFDALLTRMVNTPPLPKSEVKVAKPKPKKRKKSAA
jgi:hypothetical protein